MGCGVKFAKFVLIFFNVIFFLTGAALLAIGLTVRFYEDIWERIEVFGDVNDDDANIESGAYFLMAIGAFILVTGFLGCCGAIRENSCMLGLYIFILVVVMLAEIAAGVLVLLYRNDIEEEVIDNLKKDLDEKYEYDNGWSPIAVSMNFFQKEFECCGVEGYLDYDTVVYFHPDASMNVTEADRGCDYEESDGTMKRLPATCFEPTSGNDDKDADELVCGDVDTMKPYLTGCDDELKEFIDRWAIVFVAVALGFACLQIFGLIFAICLCRVGGKGE